jgi:hypothetical protein
LGAPNKEWLEGHGDMTIKSGMLGLAMLAGLTGAVSAAPVTYTWNFSANVGCAAVTGNPVTLCNSDYNSGAVVFRDTANKYSITARGYDDLNAPTSPTTGQTWTTAYAINDEELFGKFTSNDATETGLGLVNQTPDHEIDSHSFIQLDLSGLPTNLQSVDISISSLQSGESVTLWGSTQVNQPGTFLKEYVGTGNTVFHYDLKKGRYLSVSTDPNHDGTTNNVLIESGFKATVPEPVTLVLFGTGLAGAAAMRRRKKRAV